MKVGLVGCGRIAERGYVPAVAAAGATLVAVADVDPGRCERVAPGVSQFSSAAELLDVCDVDLLVVATPSEHHVTDAEHAALAGVRALVEKPPAPTAADAAQLVGLEPSPWIGFNRRFEPELRSMRAAGTQSDDVELGIVLTIEKHVWDAYAATDGPLTDLGSHAVDLAMWITGRQPNRVRFRTEPGDALSMDLDLADARAHVTVAHDRPWSERVTLTTAGLPIATFRAGGTVGRVLGRLGLAKAATLPELLTSQLRAVSQFMSAGVDDPALATAVEGLRVMQVLAAVASARERPGEWVRVETPGLVGASCSP